MIKIRKYGLIGYPLSHTFSPKYFAAKYEKEGIVDAQYKAYPLASIEDVKQLIDDDLDGFNVTIPYKEQILPYLDYISEEANAIGAVNTVKIVEGKLTGYNTDAYGLENGLYALLDGACVDGALVLGTGGAAKACSYVLQQMGIACTLISRKAPYMTYDQLTKEVMARHKLIINTTPLGMSPKVDACPDIPYDLLDESYFVFDLLYNPKKTLFLKRAEEKGASIMNGLSMLHDQADKSWEIWNEEENNTQIEITKSTNDRP